MQDHRFKVTIKEKGKDRYVHIDKDSFVIGRGKDADLQLPIDLISREQVRVSFDGRTIWIEELGSSNGTWLDNKRIQSKRRLEYYPEQVLSLGSLEGPFLKIEAFADEIVETHHEEVEEEVVWEVPKKAVGAPHPTYSAPVAPPKKVAAPPPTPTPQKEKLHVVKPVAAAPASTNPEDQILQIKNDGERKLFMQIKQLLGSEAEDIRQACLEEANRVKRQAEEFSLKHFKEAREKAERTIKDAEAVVTHKMNELRSIEMDSAKRLETIRNSFYSFDKNVRELKETEANLRVRIIELEDRIRFEEDRIQRESKNIAQERSLIDGERRSFNMQIEEYQLEERRSRAKLETDLLEGKMKLTQLNADADSAQAKIYTLEPIIEGLKKERFDREAYLSELKQEEHKQKLDLELVQSQVLQARQELEEKRHTLSEVQRLIEIEKVQFEKYKTEIEENRSLAAEQLRKAQGEAHEMIRVAQESVKALEERKKNLHEEVEQEYQKLRREQEASFNKITQKKADLLKEVERIAVNAHEEYHKIVAKGKEEVEALKLKGKEDLEVLREKFNAEMARLRAVTEQELSEIRDMAKIEVQDKKAKADSLIEQAQLEVLRERSQWLNEISQLEAKKSAIQIQIEGSLLEKEKILEEGKTRARDIIAEAEKSSGQLKLQMLEAAERDTKALRARAETEFKEAKAKQQNLIAEFKHVEMMKIKDMKTKAEEEWSSTRLDRAKSVSTNVFALIAGEMYKSRNKVMDENFIDTFSKELKELVVDTMLDRIGQDTDKLQQILKTSEDAKMKEKRFWRKLQIAVAVTTVVLLTVLIFPQVLLKPRDMIISAFSAKEVNDSDRLLEKMREARAKNIYNPATTVEHKETYAENVLFTTDFVARWNDQAFQDKWILELNDWFIKDLDVKDTTIIKFVSLESTLIKDLEAMKKEIDVQNTEAGIEAMKTREEEFRTKLAEIFADQNKVQRYYDYSHKFWNNHFHPRRPAGSP